MIKIKVSQKRKIIKKMIKGCLGFYHMKNKVDVEVRERKMGHQLACVQLISPNSYLLEISPKHLKDSARQVAYSIAHEMVHIKQFYCEELVHTTFHDEMLHKGSLYNLENEFEYLLAPWEYEARAMEWVLYHAVVMCVK